MRDPEMFKYDVRVRERMLKAGRLTPEDLTNVLTALPDVEANAATVDLDQPALGARSSEAAAAAREVVATPPAVLPLDRETTPPETPQGTTP